MKQYLISKKNYNGEIVYLNIDKNNGYKINPKNKVPYEGVKVNEMVVIKPDMIQKIIKRKIKNKLDFYLNYLLNDEDESDTRIALDDLQRYRLFVSKKYYIFLDGKYIALLNNKFDILERNLKSKIITSNLKIESDKIKEEEHRRSR